MDFPFIRILCVAFMAVLLLLVPLSEAQRLVKRGPIQPADDPFYTPPIGYEGETPGTILRYRTMPYPLAHAPSNFAIGFQIFYRTTDALGNAQATVTTLLVPQNPSPYKYLSYQVAEDSVFQNCAPSYGLQEGAMNGSTAEIALISAGIQAGWYVSVPDYEGPNSAYTVGPQAAHATLDNIRAVLNSGDFSGISPRARTVLWGYSGGCLATEWAVEFQASYASDLTIAGAACGGLPIDLGLSVEELNGGSSSGLIVGAIIGICRGYPQMAEYIDEHLLKTKAADFYRPLTSCLAVYQTYYEGQNISNYFDNGMGWLYDSLPAGIWQTSGTLGNHGVPRIPLFWYKSTQDEVIPVSQEDDLYSKYCADGASIQYQRNAYGTHTEEAVLGAGSAFKWLTDKVNGLETSPGCSKQQVLITSLEPEDVAALGIEIANLLRYELEKTLQQ